MRTAIVLLVAAASVWPRALAAAEEPAQGTSADELRRAAEELGSSAAKVRTSAADRLRRSGAAALPALREALRSRSPDARKPAEELLNELVPGGVWSPSARKALRETKMSLTLERCRIEDALKAFSAAAGVNLGLSPHIAELLRGREMLVSIDAQNLPAGQVLAHLLLPRGLTYDLVYDAVVVEGGSSFATLVIEQALAKKVGPFRFDRRPVREALDELRKQLDVEIVFDGAALGEAGAREREVTLDTGRELSARSVLALILAGHDLAYVYDARRIVVTTAARASKPVETRRYDISALAGHLELVRGARGAEQRVLDAVTDCVDAANWSAANSVSLDGASLVVKATETTRARVEEFLGSLGRAEKLPEPEKVDEDYF